MASASSAVMTSGRVLASSARLRRCSTSARARGLVKTRSGSRKLNGSLLPWLPPSSWATSVMVTSAPAHGWSVRSLIVWPTPLRVRACGRTSAKLGGPNSGCAGIVLARKGRFRLGHAVIVFEAVRQQQRAAVLLLGIFGQRDGRRLVGDGVERPNEFVA